MGGVSRAASLTLANLEILFLRTFYSGRKQRLAERCSTFINPTQSRVNHSKKKRKKEKGPMEARRGKRDRRQNEADGKTLQFMRCSLSCSCFHQGPQLGSDYKHRGTSYNVSRKVDVDMLNAVKSVLADVSRVSPSSLL